MAAGRLLVIAPDNDLRGSLVFALEAEGHDVIARENLPDLHWMSAQHFDCTLLDQHALVGQPYESIGFCIKAYPVVLLAARPLPWLVEWVAQVVEVPAVGNAISTAVREATQVRA